MTTPKKYKEQFSLLLHTKKNKKEPGNIVDQMGSLFVMVFMLVMVLVLIAYSKMVQMRISIDNVVKEYLYQMEEEGCLTEEMQASMKEELRDLGVDYGSAGEAISFAGTSNLGTNQAAYGDKVTLVCTMTFPNPLYETISAEKKGNGHTWEVDDAGNLKSRDATWFTIAGLEQTITYTAKMSATSKW